MTTVQNAKCTRRSTEVNVEIERRQSLQPRRPRPSGLHLLPPLCLQVQPVEVRHDAVAVVAAVDKDGAAPGEGVALRPRRRGPVSAGALHRLPPERAQVEPVHVGVELVGTARAALSAERVDEVVLVAVALHVDGGMVSPGRGAEAVVVTAQLPDGDRGGGGGGGRYGEEAGAGVVVLAVESAVHEQDLLLLAVGVGEGKPLRQLAALVRQSLRRARQVAPLVQMKLQSRHVQERPGAKKVKMIPRMKHLKLTQTRK